MSRLNNTKKAAILYNALDNPKLYVEINKLLVERFKFNEKVRIASIEQGMPIKEYTKHHNVIKKANEAYLTAYGGGVNNMYTDKSIQCKTLTDTYHSYLYFLSAPLKMLHLETYTWFNVQNQSVNINSNNTNNIINIKIMSPGKFTYTSKTDPLYLENKDLVKRTLAAIKIVEDLKEEISHVLDSVITVKRLLEVWPEALQFLPAIEPKKHLPMVLTNNINSALGL